MKKIKIVFVIMLIAIIAITSIMLQSCNSCTRTFGGTTKIQLDSDQKFLNVTWKDANIWVLTESKSTPNVYTFTEYSNGGVFEGKIIITEK